MVVLKASSPATPPARSSTTSTTNGALGASTRRLGTTVSRARSTAASAKRGMRVRAWLNRVLIGVAALASTLGVAGERSGWLMLRPSDSFDGAQPHRCGARVVLDLLGRGLLRAAGDQAQGRLVALGHDRQVGRHGRPGACGERLLDQPVLERVVAHHHDPAADADRVDRRRDRPAQHPELVVDLDPQRLERALGRVPSGTTGRGRDRVADQLDQPGRPVERLPLARARTTARAIWRANFSSPQVRSSRARSALGVVVEHVGRGRAGAVVHPHVQRGVLGVGEAALAHVELHRGDAEVEQHAVDATPAAGRRAPRGSRRTPRAPA